MVNVVLQGGRMKEHFEMIVGIILFFVLTILIACLMSWCDYQSQQRLDKIAEETRARRLECYEKYKAEGCFRI